MEVFQEVTATLNKSAKRQLGSELEDELEKIEKETQVRIGFTKGTYRFTGSFAQVVSVRNILKDKLSPEGHGASSALLQEQAFGDVRERLTTSAASNVPHDYDITFASGDSSDMLSRPRDVQHHSGEALFSGSDSWSSKSPHDSLPDCEKGAGGGAEHEDVSRLQKELNTQVELMEDKEDGFGDLLRNLERDVSHQPFNPQSHTEKEYRGYAEHEGQTENDNEPQPKLRNLIKIADGYRLMEEFRDTDKFEKKEGEKHLVSEERLPKIADDIHAKEELPSAQITKNPATGNIDSKSHDNTTTTDGRAAAASALASEECFVDPDLMEYLMKVKAYELKDIERQFFVDIECRPAESCVLIHPKKNTKQTQLDIAKDSFITLHVGVHDNSVVEGMKVPSNIDSDMVTSAVGQLQGMYANVLTKLDSGRKNIVFIGDRSLAAKAKREFILLIGMPSLRKPVSHGKGRGMSLDYKMNRASKGADVPRIFHKTQHVTSSSDGRAAETISKSPRHDSKYMYPEFFKSDIPRHGAHIDESYDDAEPKDGHKPSDVTDPPTQLNRDHAQGLCSDTKPKNDQKPVEDEPRGKDITEDSAPQENEMPELEEIDAQGAESRGKDDGPKDSRPGGVQEKGQSSGPPVKGIAFPDRIPSGIPRTLITGSGIYVDLDAGLGGAHQPRHSPFNQVYDSLDSDSEESEEEGAAETKTKSPKYGLMADITDGIQKVSLENKQLEHENNETLKFHNLEEAVEYVQENSPQPEGTLTHMYDSKSSLPGHPGEGTIIINYDFLSGRQGDGHPSPGKRYIASYFYAYLPKKKKVPTATLR